MSLGLKPNYKPWPEIFLELLEILLDMLRNFIVIQTPPTGFLRSTPASSRACCEGQTQHWMEAANRNDAEKSLDLQTRDLSPALLDVQPQAITNNFT